MSKRTKKGQRKKEQSPPELLRKQINEMNVGFDTAKMVQNEENKLSEVLLEFAEPILDRCKTSRQREAAIGLAVIAWNLGLRPEKEAKEFGNKVLDTLKTDSQEARDAIEATMKYLLIRRQNLFKDDRRLAIAYDVRHRKGRVILNVASTEI